MRQGRSSDVADENTSANETPTSVEARDCHAEHSEPMDVSAAPPSASPQIKTHRGREVSGVAVNHDTSKTPSSLTDVLWHLSDLYVRPVMPSRKSDKEVVPSLPFETPQPSDFVKMGKLLCVSWDWIFVLDQRRVEREEMRAGGSPHKSFSSC